MRDGYKVISLTTGWECFVKSSARYELFNGGDDVVVGLVDGGVTRGLPYSNLIRRQVRELVEGVRVQTALVTFPPNIHIPGG